ncbi:MAG TPA: rhodanese-like domain-containing protein, partial [Flavobacteriales bacterium]|nr:rhodanese-like domain-containing protein [Flavobacteriales bacterium]
GYDNVLGYLEGGIHAWTRSGRATDTVESIPADEFCRRAKEGKLHIYDVRRPGEWDAQHLVDAQFTPLQFINDHVGDFLRDEPCYLHCAGGYRSMTAASILKARGIHNVVDVAGGFNAIKCRDLPATGVACTKQAAG